MTKPVQVEPEARDEYLSAQDWYEAQRPGLGEDYLTAVIETLARLQAIEQHPVVRTVAGQPVRQAHVRRFPYRVVFMETPDAIRVLAIAHDKRRPDYWLRRV
ncbi:MAG: type II toxin-antitoxin system RelE/ParE family toxin [Planctomycetes bacterium]|nr:type II toxin-antitoxin system RelE/ParE family toxin [Planctomycetota bacterium]